MACLLCFSYQVDEKLRVSSVRLGPARHGHGELFVWQLARGMVLDASEISVSQKHTKQTNKKQITHLVLEWQLPERRLYRLTLGCAQACLGWPV